MDPSNDLNFLEACLKALTKRGLSFINNHAVIQKIA